MRSGVLRPRAPLGRRAGPGRAGPHHEPIFQRKVLIAMSGNPPVNSNVSTTGPTNREVPHNQALGTLNGHSVQSTQPQKKSAVWQGEDPEIDLLSRHLHLPVSLSCAMGATVNALEKVGEHPEGIDDSWPLHFTDVAVKESAKDTLSLAAQRELRKKNLPELLSIWRGVRVARAHDAGVWNRWFSVATLNAVGKTIPAAIKAKLPALIYAQRRLGLYVDEMYDPAQSRHDSFLRQLFEMAIRKSGRWLRRCGFSGSAKETHGMLKHAIAKKMDPSQEPYACEVLIEALPRDLLSRLWNVRLLGYLPTEVKVPTKDKSSAPFVYDLLVCDMSCENVRVCHLRGLMHLEMDRLILRQLERLRELQRRKRHSV